MELGDITGISTFLSEWVGGCKTHECNQRIDTITRSLGELYAKIIASTADKLSSISYNIDLTHEGIRRSIEQRLIALEATQQDLRAEILSTLTTQLVPIYRRINALMREAGIEVTDTETETPTNARAESESAAESESESASVTAATQAAAQAQLIADTLTPQMEFNREGTEQQTPITTPPNWFVISSNLGSTRDFAIVSGDNINRSSITNYFGPYFNLSDARAAFTVISSPSFTAVLDSLPTCNNTITLNQTLANGHTQASAGNAQGAANPPLNGRAATSTASVSGSSGEVCGLDEGVDTQWEISECGQLAIDNYVSKLVPEWKELGKDKTLVEMADEVVGHIYTKLLKGG